MELLLTAISTLCAGACMALGGVLARSEQRPRWLETSLHLA